MNEGWGGVLLLADGEWEPTADRGEGSRRGWSREKRDVGASRGLATLPSGVGSSMCL